MALLSGCALVWAGASEPSTRAKDLVMSDWWTMTVTVTAAMLIGKALSWLQTFLAFG